jgi:hypothetical protein
MIKAGVAAVMCSSVRFIIIQCNSGCFIALLTGTC